jgi:ribosomal protein S18 acetylase RimI-like enzyme
MRLCFFENLRSCSLPRIEQLAALTAADQAAIELPLDEFTRDRGFLWQPQPFALALRDDSGRIVGGLTGSFHWGWLRIDILSVATEFRGAGWGRQLVEEAERLAVAAGCRHAWVDTFSFQSPGFYQRLGYQLFGELPDYPLGQTRYFLAKDLTDGQSRGLPR